ncbi:MAG: type II toxin-antitoxin system prevent-host-death family antitoxin [Spirochaetota bacterium]
MIQVNVHEAKTTLSQLLEKAHAGEEIIVAKAGKPFARLVQLEHPAERIPGRYSEPVPAGFLDPLPIEELEAWEK